MSNDNSAEGKGLLRGLWATLSKPTSKWSLGALLVVGFVGGVVFWGGFNTVLELTNTETFCLSCHEMEQNVYREYRGTIHDSNRSGVRATCPDCHVPRPWIYKIQRKIQASNEVWHKLLGTIDTREKFEAKRLELAKHEWARMKETDSRECRNCHNFSAFDLTRQQARARNRHAEAEQQGKTCIDCHKGIAHQLPAGAFKAERELNESLGSPPKP
ncbi:Denitrification system component NirT [Paramagnetospirillum marisnigri]|uniref:Cytochrome c-type protein n=1 Tax=Paramagnetospirillum marisnigri TaxID=1285242 RepID=A0A178MPT7_9PROT|nr:NapC/NirT family cytochrome c [Paramagnetospirillum marisnigri]OAN50726.1 Denitrification system component NirT [Paramagnetospirillum marisnigri]